jgi:hypothetical protein
MSMRYQGLKSWLTGILCLGSAALGLSLLAQQPPEQPPTVQDAIREAGKLVALAGSPDPIYSQDAHDPWNRIFYFLFSRRLQTRISNDFPEGAPFRQEGDGEGAIDPEIRISTRAFQRNEIGDRAIDPLYPSFFVGAGSRLVLTDPAYSEFAAALREALSENVQRPVMARALMESDLWAAHDILFQTFLLADEKQLDQRRREALDLIGRLMRKIALTPDEIKSLPENYSAAVAKDSFPDVFRKGSEWVEVQWFAPRAHDSFAGFRRVSRVFLKPSHPPRDMRKFLNAKAGLEADSAAADLDGVALITQMLLVDSNGDVKPATLTTEVQVRRFEKTADGAYKKTAIQVCEISRRRLLQEPGSGGLVVEDENAAAYLGGGRYGFAEGRLVPRGRSNVTGLPVQVKLRTRCTGCHNENLAQVNTFAIAICTVHCPPGYRIPEVRQLNPSSSDQADFDISQKRKQKDFEALRGYFR